MRDRRTKELAKAWQILVKAWPVPHEMLTRLRHDVGALRVAGEHRSETGFVATALPSVRLFWADRPVARAPLSYDPGIAIIVSGRKTGFVEDRRIDYGPGQYLAVGLPLYFECETLATPSDPLLGVFLRADPTELQSLADGLAPPSPRSLPPEAGLGVEPLPIGPSLMEAVARLVRQLQDPTEASLLGPNTLREVFFYGLQDAHGRVLLSQTRATRPEARVAALLRELDARPEGASGVNSLAEAAGMSPATFHRHFKAVTGYSPLQYQKRKRLMRAKNHLVLDGFGVAETAHAVGYASVAQFSRDFSAHFGIPPSRASAYPYPV